MTDSEMIAGLDIGATRIGCAIGKIDERKRISVIGIGCSPSLGMENGVVADLPLLTSSVEKAITEAQDVAGIEIEQLFVGMGQTNSRGVNSRGVVSIPAAGREINRKDVNRVIEVARVVAKRSNIEPIETIVQEFRVDGAGAINNPVGMYGFKLEAEVYIVTGNLSSFSRTIIECVKNAGFDVEGMILKPLAAGEAVIPASEKKLGTLLIDLGGESTSVGVFANGRVAGAKILAVGANQITTDIAGKFHIPIYAAERIKREHGCAIVSLAEGKKPIDIPSDETNVRKQIPCQSLAEVIQSRLETTFNLVRKEIEGTRFPRGMGESVVLTGGGALLEGISELAHQKFGLPVRIGKPVGTIEGWGKVINSPAYSTLFGLLPSGLNRRQLTQAKDFGWQNPLSKVTRWFREFF